MPVLALGIEEHAKPIVEHLILQLGIFIQVLFCIGKMNNHQNWRS